MARVISVIFIMIFITGCSHSSVKQVQNTLDMQLQADEFYAKGACDKALPLYQSLSKAMPNDAQSLLRIGNCYAKQKQYSLAEQAYQQALVRKPKFVKAWYNLSYIRAQMLANTVSDMYKNVGENTAEADKIRALTMQVLAPFKIDIESGSQVE